MAIDFSKFDEQINDTLMSAISEAADATAEFAEVPNGDYIVKIESMEIGETKDHRPMFKAMLRISEGEYKKHCLFMNRVLYGTKNDANMIASVIGWLNKLESDEAIVFDSYSQFSELVSDIEAELKDAVELSVTYKKDAFDNIKILEVYDA